MKKRLIGAFIVLSVLITSLILGDNVFAIVISIIALLGLKELIDIKYKNRNIIFIKILTYILLGLFMFNNLVLKFDNKIVICASLILLIFKYSPTTFNESLFVMSQTKFTMFSLLFSSLTISSPIQKWFKEENFSNIALPIPLLHPVIKTFIINIFLYLPYFHLYYQF